MADGKWDERLLDGWARDARAAANERQKPQKIGFRMRMRSPYGRASMLWLPIYVATGSVFGPPWALLFLLAWLPIAHLLDAKTKKDLLAKGHEI